MASAPVSKHAQGFNPTRGSSESIVPVTVEDVAETLQPHKGFI